MVVYRDFSCLSNNSIVYFIDLWYNVNSVSKCLRVIDIFEMELFGMGLLLWNFY